LNFIRALLKINSFIHNLYKRIVMHISQTPFASDLQRYLTDHPGDAGDEAHRSLTTLAERTFENAEENDETGTETGIQNLGQDYLIHIFSFLHLKDQGQAGAVCRTWLEALRCRQR
jgi:hypothetical protein